MTVDKHNLRREVLRRREQVPSSRRAADDHARADLVLSRLTSPPSTVAAYLSGRQEPGTWAIVQALHDAGVRVIVPALSPDPDWVSFEGTDRLRTGRWDISEPTGEPLGAGALSEAGVILVPGLLGTLGGARLGRGGGWYDKALRHASSKAGRWLLLNDDEVVDDLPTEEHDLPVSSIVTPIRWLDCGE